MTGLLKRVFGRSSSPSESRGLDRLKGYGDNTVYVEATRDRPAHLVAHGRIKGAHTGDVIRTAVSIEGDDTQFATNVGQVLDSAFGAAVTDGLNYRVKGKVVTDPEVREPGRRDLLYTTRRSTKGLDRARFHSELEHHAETREVVGPILTAASKYGQPEPGLSYSELRAAAGDVVDTNFAVQGKWSSRFSRDRYVPIPVENEI